jgi:hypothetical protein
MLKNPKKIRKNPDFPEKHGKLNNFVKKIGGTKKVFFHSP